MNLLLEIHPRRTAGNTHFKVFLRISLSLSLLYFSSVALVLFLLLSIPFDCFNCSTMPTAMSTSTDTPRKRAKSVTFAPPPPQEDDTFRTGVAAILGILVIGGAYTLHYHSYTNGLFDACKDLIQGDTFPGSNEPYRRVFTGIKPFDAYLSNFLPFFAAVSGKDDDSSYLFWIWMIAQFGAQWAMLVMESMREGNNGKTSS